ncbi:AraC family ligand binding domain-containing protein [Aliivibrio salmonicida]|uniref:AraC family ligand binding domain-containing protein n=1 Tax=Aliivibrio salmonicida TaxID=40269 RepID=UPI00406C6108
MKNAITFQSETHSHLIYTARKKKNQYELISVQTGVVLIRLGKWEYQVLPGELFWLPFDALTSMTVVPNSTVSTVAFSIRTREYLPTQGGYISPTSLLISGLDKLQQKEMSEASQQRLLHVLQDELLEATIHTDLSTQSQDINTYLSLLMNEKDTKICRLDPELMMTLKVREADKMRKSGKKSEAIARRYFSGDVNLLNQACSLLL